MKRMSEGQLARVAGDEAARRSALSQLATWEASLERLSAQRYRAECYIASLRALELPNPKVPYRLLSSQHCTSDTTSIRYRITTLKTHNTLNMYECEY